MAWLLSAADHATKEDHHTSALILTHEARVRGRSVIALLLEGQALLAREREKVDGEGDEPVGLP